MRSRTRARASCRVLSRCVDAARPPEAVDAPAVRHVSCRPMSVAITHAPVEGPEPSEHPDLRPARGGPGRGGSAVLARGPLVALDRARDLRRWRRSPTISTAISPAPMRSNRRSGACSIRSPTSSSSRPACSCWSPTAPSTGWVLWAAIVILCREILVSGLREFLAELKVERAREPGRQVEDHRAARRRRLPHRRPGGRDRASRAPIAIGIVLLWAAAILTLYTGWDYLKSRPHHLVDEA